ncbi:MAG: type I methionyl aminopeptidase [Planctomycetales bacterium]|nr:type I methionyl aminopeptidase [Planctomycetales bacterium]
MWQLRSPSLGRSPGPVRAPEVKGPEEIACMREAGDVVAEALERAGELCRPGVRTSELDRAIEELIRRRGAEPAFKGLYGYPATICASVNEEVVHGLPGRRALREGDIIGVDVGAIVRGYHGDAARTIAVGTISPEASRLLETCREALERAIAAVGPGVRVSTLSRTIQAFVEGRGYSVVREYVGHGIGRRLHEDPQVPNFVPPDGPENDVTLRAGMAIAIEPMVNGGGAAVETLPDRWTVVTKDRTLSAHFEDTVAVTDAGREVLTARSRERR